MTGANDEETASPSDGDGKTEVTDTSPLDSSGGASVRLETGAELAGQPEEVESGVVELLEVTPEPVAVPVIAKVAAQESTRRPPPVPRSNRASEHLPTLGAHLVPLPAVAAAEPTTIEPEPFSPEAAVADARKRVEQASAGDRMALARARTELGLLLEIAIGDSAAALAEYRAAHSVSASLAAPLACARRLVPLHPSAPALALLEDELRLKSEAPVRARRELELGMLLRASGSATERTWQAYREALAIHPAHAGALRGLESALVGGSRISESATQWEALAAHREVMASVFRSDARLSAWLEVERGQLLDKLGRADAAAAAFEAALALDGGVGPVRDAYTRHLIVQGKVDELVKAWATEATLETDGARAARLLYSAARLVSDRLDQKNTAIELFERAVATDAAAASIRRAALRELFCLYESLGHHESTVATGNRLLAFARDNERAYWHRRLVAPCQALGHPAEVALHAQHVLAAAPSDEAMRAALDQAHTALGQHEQRVAMLTEEAARATALDERVQLFLQAAQVAERDMGRADLALAALRSAFACDAGNPDVTDAIARLLTPGTPPSLTDPDDPSRVRARIDFYAEAAAAASDPARKVAHLEKLALLWEDEVRAPERAMAVYGDILAIEPNRRSAVVGLARCAGRAGNARELVRALVMEADLASNDPTLERSLLLRAADVAVRQLGDHETASDLVKRVLGRAADPSALRAAFHIHDRAGRPVEALAHLRLLLAHKNKSQSTYSIQSEIARFLEDRLHRAGEALTAWREAHRLEPGNPTPRTEVRRILVGHGDFRAVAEEMAALAMTTNDPGERGELLIEAAEIYDDRLGDAERAIPLLVEARSLLPDDMLIVDRLDRAYLRTGKRPERLALLQAVEATDPRGQFALAALQAEDRDPARALKRLAELAEQPSTCVPALRVLEHALRRTERWGDLDAVLRRQVVSFSTIDAKLGSVFELLSLEEYDDAGTPEGQAPARELLAGLVPDDLLAHELRVRDAGLARNGSPNPAVVPSLDRLAAAATDPLTAAALQLAEALILESHPAAAAQKEALLAFATALAAWPDNLTAARGARRLAARLGEPVVFVQAASTLGSLEPDASTRAMRLLEAAEASAKQEGGALAAFDFACRALGEDPNHGPAADAVIAAAQQAQDAGKAVEALRGALDRSTLPEQAAKLGVGLAHLALSILGDQTVALEALRRARKRAPKHTGALLALADLSQRMGLQSEAVEAATAALSLAREPADKTRAAVSLAEVHARMSAFRDTARREAREAEKWAERGGVPGDVIARLAAVHQNLGDESSAERVLIQSIVLAGEDYGALVRLCMLFGSGREAGERLGSALRKAMAAAESSGKPRRGPLLAALGRVEAGQLGQKREGLVHLEEALRLAPNRVEVYEALVDAHGSDHEEAVRSLTAHLGELGRAAATTDEVTRVLSLLLRTSQKAQRPESVATAEALLAFFSARSVEPPANALPESAPRGGALGPKVLLGLVGEGCARWLDLARVLGEPINKVLAHAPENLGLSPAGRLSARSSHPLRGLADRVARAFGELRFDLYVDATATDVPRLLDTTPPALVLPKGFGGFSQREQTADLARLLAYVALDVPWLDGLDNEETDGILLGGLRTVDPFWGQGELSASAEKAAATWRSRLAKATSRKVRRGLEDVLAGLRPQPDTSAWRRAVRAAALEAAYGVCGDLGATLHQGIRGEGLGQITGDELASKVLAHPALHDLIAFALSPAAPPLLRSAGH